MNARWQKIPSLPPLRGGKERGEFICHASAPLSPKKLRTELFATPTDEPMTRPKTTHELLAGYRNQLLDTTRKTVAIRKKFPGHFVRFRRAAPTGPNSGTFLVFLFDLFADKAKTVAMPAAELEALAAEVTDEEVGDFYAKADACD